MVIQSVMAALGIWLFAARGYEYVWAVPSISHFQNTLLGIFVVYQLQQNMETSLEGDRTRTVNALIRACSLGAVHIAAFVISVFICFGTWEIQHFTQCILCVFVLLEKGLWKLYLRRVNLPHSLKERNEQDLRQDAHWASMP